MDDFIFGTLATDDLRASHLRLQRAGITHASMRSPRDPLPGQPITLDLTVGPAYPFEQAWIYWTTDGSDPVGENGMASNGQCMQMEMASVEWDTFLWGYVRRFRGVLPGQAAGSVLRYRIGAGNSAPFKSSTKTPGEILADGGAFYACYIADDPQPSWAQEAVIYQIFVDRFNPGRGKTWLSPSNLSGFYGGTLRGILDKLDFIRDLGVNVLWLSPIFPSPSHHGYDATDYFDIEPRLGSKADLKDLLEAAHAQGMRVLLDFVPNHWSSQHPSFQAAISDPKSPYRDWYTFRRYPQEYETFFGVRSLPQVNLRYPAARQHMLDAAAYWLDFGVDGYRVDYAIGPSPDFWADFRRATRQARPDCWTFGEVVDPPDSQTAFEGGLDGCLDFVLLEALRQTFAFARWDALRFADFLDRHEAYFPASFSRPSFLDNHDMNRFLWAAGWEKDRKLARQRLRLAALCQFTLYGPPVVYYGTEVGLSQAHDIRQGKRGVPEESRQPMIWSEAQDKELLGYYRALIDMRRREAILRRGTRHTLMAEDNLLVYSRDLEEHTLLVALNLSTNPQTAHLETECDEPVLASDPACKISRSGSQVEIQLPPVSGTVLQPIKG